MDNIVDLTPLTRPQPEATIELMDDETKILMESSRCQACRHLSCFHMFGFSQDPKHPDNSRYLTKSLQCRICQVVCSYD